MAGGRRRLQAIVTWSVPVALHVLKKGAMPKAEVFEWFGVCDYCGCEMLADEWDPRWPPSPPNLTGSSFGNDPPYDPKRCAGVACGTCGKSMLLKKRHPASK